MHEGKGSLDMKKRYIAPEWDLIPTDPESILVTTQSGIRNGGANEEEGWGQLIPIRLSTPRSPKC